MYFLLFLHHSIPTKKQITKKITFQIFFIILYILVLFFAIDYVPKFS